jgi:hypothetical protein
MMMMAMTASIHPSRSKDEPDAEPLPPHQMQVGVAPNASGMPRDNKTASKLRASGGRTARTAAALLRAQRCSLPARLGNALSVPAHSRNGATIDIWSGRLIVVNCTAASVSRANSPAPLVTRSPQQSPSRNQVLELARRDMNKPDELVQ